MSELKEMIQGQNKIISGLMEQSTAIRNQQQPKQHQIKAAPTLNETLIKHVVEPKDN